jgi:outer membrane murein-binding lipoprotein Lpp
MRFITCASARIALALAVILSVLSLAGCTDDQQKAVASNVDRLAVLIQDAREVRDSLVEQGAIDNQSAFEITRGLVKVNGALKVFNSKARAYATAGDTSPAAKADLKLLAASIADAATDLVNNGAIGINDPKKQNEYSLAISAIKQAALAVLDAIERLKTKPAPAPLPQRADFGYLGIIPLLLQSVRQLLAFVDRERARSGKTYEEIFDEAGAQLDANEIALLQDLAKYSTNPLPPVAP